MTDKMIDFNQACTVLSVAGERDDWHTWLGGKAGGRWAADTWRQLYFSFLLDWEEAETAKVAIADERATERAALQ